MVLLISWSRILKTGSSHLWCLLCILHFPVQKDVYNVAIGYRRDLNFYMSGRFNIFFYKDGTIQSMLWLRYGALHLICNSEGGGPPHALSTTPAEAVYFRTGNPIFIEICLRQSNIGNGFLLFQVTRGHIITSYSLLALILSTHNFYAPWFRTYQTLCSFGYSWAKSGILIKSHSLGEIDLQLGSFKAAFI